MLIKKKKKSALGFIEEEKVGQEKEECKITKQSLSQVCSGGYVTGA
jgi:hypothetical protein